jgi:hypothetical protein
VRDNFGLPGSGSGLLTHFNPDPKHWLYLFIEV